ncbi:MAG: hypothetical protein HeimC3_49210 [Candidatus Heimdallarchaeota archaeon LC_3]|nr:MAG: hypothetical protein HeimC3_49210 [Candidatus Heimdallarchaeota archaeon LC_3]
MSPPKTGQKSYNKVFKCPICKKEYKYFKWLIKHVENIQHKKILISGNSILHQQELYDLLGLEKPIKSSRRQVKLKKYL